MADDVIWSLDADGEGTLATIDDIDAALSELADSIAATAESASDLDGLDESLSGIAEQTDVAASSTDSLMAAISQLSDAVGTLTGSVDALDASVSDMAAAFDEAAAGADAAATAEDDAAASTEGLSGALDGLQAAMGPLMMLGTVAAMAGGKFVQMGLDGQKGEAMLEGMAGASQADVAALENEAIKFGETMDQASAGFYEVESAGYAGSQAISVFDAAMKLSEGGQASAQDVMSGLTAIMHDYSAKASDATYYTDLMAKTVLLGKQSMQDYATSIGPLASAAENVGISFDQVSAAEATMTQINPHVRQDTQQLASLFQSLSPTMGTVVASAKKLGLSFDEQKYASMDLLDKLKYLALISGGDNTAAFVKLTGGVRGSTAAIDLLKGNAATFTSNLTQMQHAAGTTNAAFGRWEETIPAAMDKTGAALSIFATKLMDAIGPTVTPLIDDMTHDISDFADEILNHTSQVMPVLVALAAVIAGALVAALAALVIAVGPVLLALAAIGVAAAGVTMLVQAHMSTISAAFTKMDRDAELSTLQMKLKTTQSTLSMAEQNVDNIRMQEEGVVHEIQQTSDAHTKAMLEMKLKALQASQEQADGVVKNITKERTGIEAQMDQLNPQLQLKNLERTDQAVSATVEMTQRTIAGYSQMKAGIEAQLAATTDDAKKHALEMQLAQIEAAQKQKEGVLKQLEAQRVGTEKAMSGIRNELGAEQNNPILRLIGAFQAFGAMIARAFTTVMAVIRPFINDLNNMIKSDFLPIWQQLASLWQNEIVPQGKQLGQSFQQLWIAIQPLMPVLRLLGEFLAGVLVVALGGIIGILSGLMRGIATFLGAIVGAIGGVIQVFSGIIQMVVGMVTLIVDLVTGHFGKLHGDLENILKGIETMFSGLWTIAKNLFTAGVGTILAIVSGFFSGIIGFFTRLKDELVGHSIVPDMVNGIVHFFASLPGKVFGIVTGLVSGVIGHFTHMAQEGLSWIAHLVTGGDNQMQQMRDQSALHTAQMKQQTVDHLIQQNVAGIAAETQMKEGLIREISETKDAHKRHILEMQVDAINKMIAMRERSIAEAEQMHQAIADHIAQLKNKVAQDSSDMHDNFISRMLDLAAQSRQHILDLVNSIASNLGSLGSKALGWGADMIHGFISGIESGVGKLGQVVGNIAGSIASKLHFSKPDEPPLSDADRWMPDMIDLFVSGINANAGKMRQAMSGITGAISGAVAPHTGGVGAGPGIGAAPLAGGSSANILLAQILGALQGQNRPGIGQVTPSITQYNQMSLYGNQSLQSLYNSANEMAGYQNEQYARGAG